MLDTKHRQMALMLAPAQEKLIGRDIAELCENAAVTIDSETNALLLPSLGEVIRVRLPDFVITQELDMWRHLTLLQYLDTADGTPLTGKEIALSEMRGGLSRGLGFDKDISLMFSRDLRDTSADAFARACEALGGRIVPGKADVSAVIPYAPRFPVTVHFWCGDEEFPASLQYLWDAGATDFLFYETLGYVAGALTEELTNAIDRIFHLWARSNHDVIDGKVRKQEESLSESQRFFIDHSFRMSILTFFYQSPSFYIVETPDSSLDLSYEQNAAGVFLQFLKKPNIVIVTSNLNNSSFISHLTKDESVQLSMVGLLDIAKQSAIQGGNERIKNIYNEIKNKIQYE